MKKIILFTILAFILANCEISPRKVNATNVNTHFIPTSHSDDVSYYEYNNDGLEYHVYSRTSSSQNAAIFVLNHTREVLETELIRLQIEELKKKLNEK